MSADPSIAVDVLNRRFLTDFPTDAAFQLEDLPAEDGARVVRQLPVRFLVPVVERMLPQASARLLTALPPALSERILAELPPLEAVRILGHATEADRAAWLDRLDPAVRRDLDRLLTYPLESAGHLMDASVPAFRRDATAAETLRQLRIDGMKTARSLFVVDEQHRLTGKVRLTDLALAGPETPLSTLERAITVAVRPSDPVDAVTEAFTSGDVLDLPVVDIDGVFLGAVTHDDLAHTVEEQSSADIQTMVGASKDERALSSPMFAVRKRMPWLQINLLTAFLAAAVVGLFEDTISRVTALAVLLPVVAGQSGNAGAQALAITMRGLALREITLRQWTRVTRKELVAGLLNGLGIAATCGAGVYAWSQSFGLVLVIVVSMSLAMIIAGFAGAIIPMALTRFGQDPATSSSIILTTVTDVAGFFSFLGTATLLMHML